MALLHIPVAHLWIIRDTLVCHSTVVGNCWYKPLSPSYKLRRIWCFTLELCRLFCLTGLAHKASNTLRITPSNLLRLRSTFGNGRLSNLPSLWLPGPSLSRPPEFCCRDIPSKSSAYEWAEVADPNFCDNMSLLPFLRYDAGAQPSWPWYLKQYKLMVKQNIWIVQFWLQIFKTKLA